MSDTSIAFIGFAAATLTTAAFVPQVVQTFRTKRTKDISLGMYSAMTAGIFLWLGYGILLNNPPMYIANGITAMLASTILFLKIKHG